MISAGLVFLQVRETKLRVNGQAANSTPRGRDIVHNLRELLSSFHLWPQEN